MKCHLCSFKSRSVSLEEDQDVYSTLTVQQEILQQEEDGRASDGTDAKGFGEKSITFWGYASMIELRSLEEWLDVFHCTS